MTSSSLGHLHPEMQAAALLPDDERISRIRAERWIANPAATIVLDLLGEVLEQPPRDRMENLLLVAESGMGKMTLLRKFERSTAVEGRDAGGARRMAVVSVLMPPRPTERDFFGSLLDALGAPVAAGTAYPDTVRRLTACRLLREVGARVLVVDEINSLLAGTPRQQRLFLQLLRFVSNEVRVALVCAGVPEARHALLSDPQLRGRFAEHEIPPWEAGPDLQTFINRIVQGLPLRRASAVDAPPLCRLLAERTAGITLYIRRVLERAAIAAIRSGEECITPESLSSEATWRGVEPLRRAPAGQRGRRAAA